MRLSAYIGALSDLVAGPVKGDPEITGVTNKAADVRPGMLFCAIKGAKHDGHDYLADAVARGAAALVIHQDFAGALPAGSVPVIRVRDSYSAWGVLCSAAAGNPAQHFRVHGVTGTNGKTTIAILLHYFLTAAAKRKCGLLTTVFNDVCDGKRTDSVNTMPDAAALQSLFSQLRDNGAEDVSMECSSHGLSQNRSGLTRYITGIFTNLTGDHLDYHKTMEAYYQAKKRLFTELAAPGMTAVINIDDAYGKRLYDELAGRNVHRIAVSAKDPSAEAFIERVALGEAHTEILLKFSGRKLVLTSQLTGLHNVFNMVQAFAAAASQGISLDLLADTVRTAPPAPGRLERFRLRNGAHAFVDYAHTDDALLRVIEALNALKKPGGRLITVFGCGGDRDRTKRPRMGKVVSEHSNLAIVTSDNPRTEKPEAIIEEILAGIAPELRTKCTVEPDRAKAIALAMNTALPDDLLLIAGKGHETYQEINGIRHDFDDRAEVRKGC